MWVGNSHCRGLWTSGRWDGLMVAGSGENGVLKGTPRWENSVFNEHQPRWEKGVFNQQYVGKTVCLTNTTWRKRCV